MKVRIQDEWFERQKVAEDTKCVYLFGDNYLQQWSGKGARATQAVIRGLPNAIGIPTKHNPGSKESSYLSDDDYSRFVRSTLNAITWAVRSNKTIVIPRDGIGTGAADLENRAPKCYGFLYGVLLTLYYAGNPYEVV